MKYFRIIERYRKGSPEMRKNMSKQIVGELKRLINDKAFSDMKSIKDQSSDKGMKFEVRIGKDIVHIFVTDDMFNPFEFYLNKRKSNKSVIQRYFDKKYLSDVEEFLEYAGSYDYYASYIDDGRKYRRVMDNNKSILDRFSKLSSSEKRDAVKGLLKKYPNDRENIKKVFKA